MASSQNKIDDDQEESKRLDQSLLGNSLFFEQV
jgi:hypothetical protein